MSDINITVNDEIVNIDVIDTPVYVEVTNSPGPAGAGVAAGGTTGQVLAKASNTNYDTVWVNPSTGGVPYSGATGDVSLGEYGINVGNVIYDTTPTGIPTDQGATYWDTDAETVALIMNGTIQKIGEDTFYHVRNTTGSTISKGTAVRFSGTTGNSGRLLIAPMLADGTYPSQYYMGITSEELVNNADGKVYHFGKMRNINTSAFADGDVLYVSPSVAGALTATAPVAPNNIIVAAAVVHAANNGTLMIRTTLGSNINSDEGVLLTTPTANQGLFYDSGLWVNKSITTALGYTPVPTTRNITINGVTYDLSADRTWTIAAGISGSGAAGQVTYWTGASAVSGSNNLFWDNANGRLGIGTNAPTTSIDILLASGVSNGDMGLFVRKSTGYFFAGNGTGAAANFFPIFVGRANYDENPLSFQGNLFNTTTIKPAILFKSYNFAGSAAISTGQIVLGVQNGTSRLLNLYATGNLVLQNGGTFTDGGQRLQVIGDTLLRGSGATSATTALTVQNSSSTNLLVVQNHGGVGIGSTALTGKTLVISKNITGSTIPDAVRNDGVIQSDATNSTNYFITNASTAAASFTLTNLRHYISVQGTIGAGSIVTNQFGYFAHSSLTGATNNFGFYGDIASGTGRWNLYMNGTADNYLAGNLGIGITPTVRLHVSGDTILRGSGATSATTALTVQNSSSTNLFTVRNDGFTTIGADYTFASTTGYNILNSNLITFTNSFGVVNQTCGAAIFNIFIDGNQPFGNYNNVFSTVTNRNSNTTSNFRAGTFSARTASSGAATLLVASSGSLLISGSGNVTNAVVSDITIVSDTSAKTITNLYGIRINALTNSAGTITNTYGIYLDSLTSGTQTNAAWGIYQNGTNNNYLAGNVAIGSTSNTTDWLNIAASTTVKAHINLAAGIAPTSPANGDIWFDGTNIQMRIGGVTKTFTLI